MAAGPTRRGRTRLGVQPHRVARDRSAHADRMGLLRAGADPARPGPPGRGRADLRASPGQSGHVRPAGAGRRSELCGAGRDRLPARRTRRRPAARDRGNHAVPPVRLHPPLAGGLATVAMIRQATGDLAGALEAITEAGQAAPGPAGLLNPVPARRARLLLAQGDLIAAASFAQDNGLGPDDEPDYARESGYLVLARLLFPQDHPGQSLALLDRLHAAAKVQNRTGSLIEISALRALALAATGDETDAVTTLAGTLLLTCPQGYVRVFADEGPPMAALLGRPIAAQRTGSGFRAAAEVPLGYLARLQRAFGPGRPARDSVPSGSSTR